MEDNKITDKEIAQSLVVGLSKKEKEEIKSGIVPETLNIKVVKAFLARLRQSLHSGEKVRLLNLGRFELKERAATKRKHFKTGKIYDVPAKNTLVFYATKKNRQEIF